TVGELSGEPHAHARALARPDPFTERGNEAIRRTGIGRRTATGHFEQGPVVVDVAELDAGRADVDGQNLDQPRVMKRRHLEIVVRTGGRRDVAGGDCATTVAPATRGPAGSQRRPARYPRAVDAVATGAPRAFRRPVRADTPGRWDRRARPSRLSSCGCSRSTQHRAPSAPPVGRSPARQ